MTEILRPFRQGRRQLAMLGDRDLLPFSAHEYRLYLESDHWRAFTKSYHEDRATAKECFVCGSSTYDLHHITYARLGHEQFEDVIALCRSHHEEVHRVARAGKKLRDAHIYVRERCRDRTVSI